MPCIGLSRRARTSPRNRGNDGGKVSEKNVVNEMYCFVAENDQGEGIMGFRSHQGWVPMVGMDMARVKALYPIAKQVSAAAKCEFKVLKFSNREDITELTKDMDKCDCPSPVVTLTSPPTCNKCNRVISIPESKE